MTKEKVKYRKDTAFINREKEQTFLDDYINERPESLLFIHGPKSSGKTTLLYKFLEQTQREQKLDVKFMDLRETFTNGYQDFIKAFFHVETQGEKKRKNWRQISMSVSLKSMPRWKRKSLKNGPILSKL